MLVVVVVVVVVVVAGHDGSFGVGGCGWVLALIQATRTLLGWSTRWSRARASTRSASPATWATAMATTWRSRVVSAAPAARSQQIPRNRGEQRGGHHGGHVVTGLGPLDDLGDGGVAARHQVMDHVVGFGGHGWSVGGTPDTALSRNPRAYPVGSDRGVGARCRRVAPRRRVHPRPAWQDDRSAGSSRPRGRGDGPHREVDRGSLG